MLRKFIVGAACVAALSSVAVPARAAAAFPLQDRSFAITAAQGGAAEVADARQALQTSRNQSIDAFANRMITDHSKANATLIALMRRQGMPLPAGIGAENQAAYSRIEALTGRDFNTAYIGVERTAHMQTIALFEREVQTGKDPQLVAFAKATLPVIRMHLAMLAKVVP